MKVSILVIISAFVFFSCNQGNEKTIPASADTAIFTPPVIKANDSSSVIQPLALSPAEMKDDSVFADGSVPTSWKNAGFSDVKGFKLFLKQAQLWVMDNDKEKLASVIRYPLKNIKTPQELVANYDAVFTKRVKLSFATIHFSQIFRKDLGAMTDEGTVWFRQEGKEFKIIAIN